MYDVPCFSSDVISWQLIPHALRMKKAGATRAPPALHSSLRLTLLRRLHLFGDLRRGGHSQRPLIAAGSDGPQPVHHRAGARWDQAPDDDVLLEPGQTV